MGKIKTREELREAVERLKSEGKKIVTCNGAFDMVHVGHLKFLEEAKAQGDILIVGINSDSSIKQYKSKDRPFIPEQYRAELVAGLECVDYVTIFNEVNPLELLKVIKPDVHVNGEDYGEDCIEAPLVKGYGGRIHVVRNFWGFSTTKLIEKIKKS